LVICLESTGEGHGEGERVRAVEKVAIVVRKARELDHLGRAHGAGGG